MKDTSVIAAKAHRPIEIRRIQGSVQRKGGEPVISRNDLVMAPSLRKFALTAHVTSSVGWLGAVAASLALAVAGLMSQDSQTMRAAYISMD